MPVDLPTALRDLPSPVSKILSDFVETAQAAFGPDLRAILLFGSAAEGKLRPTSDVNVLILLTSFAPDKVDRLRESLHIAQAAVRLKAMFLLEHELQPAAEAFAQKFADVRRRRRLLYGQDPFDRITIPHAALITRLKQVLLNLTLRLREAYALRSQSEDQVSAVVADYSGPLRTSAAALLELEGAAASSPKEALERIAASLDDPTRTTVLADISKVREGGALPPGVAGQTLLRMSELATRLRERAARLG